MDMDRGEQVIEGEKQFKDALKEINQNFKILKSEMNLVIRITV